MNRRARAAYLAGIAVGVGFAAGIALHGPRLDVAGGISLTVSSAIVAASVGLVLRAIADPTWMPRWMVETAEGADDGSGERLVWESSDTSMLRGNPDWLDDYPTTQPTHAERQQALELRAHGRRLARERTEAR